MLAKTNCYILTALSKGLYAVHMVRSKANTYAPDCWND
jgi:hypothetical protein